MSETGRVEILPPEEAASRASDSGRISMIVMYALYFATFITAGLTFFAAMVLAYLRRGELRGTVYESHVRNGIEVFWVTAIGFVVGLLTARYGIGIAILFTLPIWYLYRTIKGFLRALDARAFR